MDKRRKLTDAQEAEICQAYQTGKSLAILAVQFSMTPSGILAVLKRNKISRRPPGSRYTPNSDRDRDLRTMHEQGWGARKIAEACGVSHSTARRWLARAGLARSPGRPIGSRYESYLWAGGVIEQQGYRAVWMPKDDPLRIMAWSNGYVPEHRLVMARSLGRLLEPHETVHHINGDKTDNRLENLQLRNGRHGKGARFTCLDCGSHNISAAPL